MATNAEQIQLMVKYWKFVEQNDPDALETALSQVPDAALNNYFNANKDGVKGLIQAERDALSIRKTEIDNVSTQLQSQISDKDSDLTTIDS